MNEFSDDLGCTKCLATPKIDTKRAFFMGNALVVGVVEKLGKSLANRAD